MAQLHGGELRLEDNHPGLKSIIALPRGGPVQSAGMKRPAKKPVPAKKSAGKTAVHTKSAAPTPSDAATLAGRIVTAPRLLDRKLAQARVAEWLAGLPAAAAKALKAVFAAHPTVNTLMESLAESSPFLWDLASREPERLVRLMGAEPDMHLADLLADHRRAIAATDDDAEAMRLLRHMKAEAALLIALADIGGVWPVMRATRALTDLADAAVDAATHFVLAEAARAGRLSLKGRTQAGSGYIVLAMGKMGACELNYSSDIDLIVLYDAAASSIPDDAAPAPIFVRITQRLVKLLQERTGDGYVFRTDLRLRPRSGLDGDRDLDRCGLALLRKRRAELGTRRHDQGARPAPAISRRGRRSSTNCRPSSGANISISLRWPKCTP